MNAASQATSCAADAGCITCGDVAVVLTVTAVADADANCIDLQGRHEWVAIELVGDVQPGDRLLVHAGVALELLGPVSESLTATSTEGDDDAFR